MKLLRLLAILACSGCAIPGQETFAPAPDAKPVADTIAAVAAPRIDPRAPLITIEYATPNPDFRELLRLAVRAAEARKPGVLYDVVAVVKTADDTSAAQDRAGQVMRAIMAERVPTARIHLGLRAEPSMPGAQVRVYVR